MILQRIQHYFTEHHQATVPELARALNITASALQPMLMLLEQKGRIRKNPPPACGSRCGGCRSGFLEIYVSYLGENTMSRSCLEG